MPVNWAKYRNLLLLRDGLLTDEAAPLTSPRETKPGRGTVYVHDTANKLSISGGKLTETGGITTAHHDPGLMTQSFPRSCGLAMGCLIAAHVGTSDGPAFGWIDDYIASGHTFLYGFPVMEITHNYLWISAGIQWQSAVTWNPTTQKFYEVILRSNGAWLVWDGRLQHVTFNNTVTPAYAGFWPQSDFSEKLKEIRVAQLDPPWDDQWGIATDYQASPAANAVGVMEADGFVEATYPVAAGEVFKLMFRRVDDNNTWYVELDVNANTIKLYTISGGVTSLKDSDVQTCVAGKSIRIFVKAVGADVRVWAQELTNSGHNLLTPLFINDAFNQTKTGTKVDKAVTDFCSWPYNLPAAAVDAIDLCFTEAPRVPTTFYFDSVGGDDANDGLGAGTPKKTLTALNAISKVPGDTFLIKYGSEYRGKLVIVENGLVGLPITFGAYGNPADGKPIFNDMYLRNQLADWSNYAGDIWRTPTTWENNRTFINGVAAGRAATRDLVDAAHPSFTENLYTYVHSVGNPAATYVAPGVELAQLAGATVDLSSRSYITIQNLHLKGGTSGCVYLNDTSYCIIDSCDITHPGGFGIQAQGTMQVSYNTIRDCYINNNRDVSENTGNSSNPWGRDGIIFYDRAIGNLVHGNTVIDFEHGQIGVNGAVYGHDNIFEFNDVSSPVCDFGYGFSIGMPAAGGGHDNIVRFNWIHDCAEVGIQVTGVDIYVYYNILKRCKNQCIDVYSTAWAQSDRVYIWNNVCYSGYAAYSNLGNGIRLDGWSYNITNVEIKNNILIDCSGLGGIHYQLYLNNDHSTFTNIEIENNIMVTTGGDTKVISGNTSFVGKPYTVAEAEALYPYMQNNVQLDPLFTNGSGTLSLDSDFDIAGGSPAIGAGVNVGLTLDYAGNAVANPPNIGAYE